jgi:hypothetical protein
MVARESSAGYKWSVSKYSDLGVITAVESRGIGWVDVVAIHSSFAPAYVLLYIGGVNEQATQETRN